MSSMCFDFSIYSAKIYEHAQISSSNLDDMKKESGILVSEFNKALEEAQFN
mgnify:CR=1 FL=1